MVSNFCPSQPQLADVGIKAALHDILNKNVLLYVWCVCVCVCVCVVLKYLNWLTLTRNAFQVFGPHL